MQNYDYSRLHSSLVGVIQEAQTKIGYDRHAITFYYPAASLAHMLGTKEDADTVEQALAGFSAFAQPTLGGGILHAGLFILACLVPSAALFAIYFLNRKKVQQKCAETENGKPQK